MSRARESCVLIVGGVVCSRWCFGVRSAFAVRSMGFAFDSWRGVGDALSFLIRLRPGSRWCFLDLVLFPRLMGSEDGSGLDGMGSKDLQNATAHLDYLTGLDASDYTAGASLTTSTPSSQGGLSSGS